MAPPQAIPDRGAMDGSALETERLRLYPMNAAQLTRALYDPRGAAYSVGAEMRGQGYGFLEMMFKRRIYRAKLELMSRFPELWLLSTMWLIVDKASGEMVGEIGFKGPPRGGEVELGYSVRLAHRSNGFMTEAVEAMCRFAFSLRTCGISTVCALTNPDNYPSHRVLQKNGFVHDGRRGKFWYWKKDGVPLV